MCLITATKEKSIHLTSVGWLGILSSKRMEMKRLLNVFGNTAGSATSNFTKMERGGFGSHFPLSLTNRHIEQIRVLKGIKKKISHVSGYPQVSIRLFALIVF